MNQNTIYLCRLCLKECQYFETIEESHQEIFNTLLLTLNLAISHEPVVCKACIERLRNCLVYKNVSLHMEEYLRGDNCCMFCHKCTVMDRFALLNSDQLDMILLKAMMEQFFPELDLKSIPNPMICIQCYEGLQKNIDFFVKCLNVEQQIKKYCESVGTNNKGQVDLRDVINLKIEGTGSTNEKNTPLIKIEEDSYVERLGIGNDTSVRYFYINKEDGNIKDTVKLEELSNNDSHDGVDQMIFQNSTEPYMKHTYNEAAASSLRQQVKIEHYEVVDKVTEAIEAVVKKYSYSDEEIMAQRYIQLQQEKEESEKNYEVDEIEEDNEVTEWWSYIASSTKNNSQNQEYYTKSELRQMITTTYISGEKKYQCQVCMFVGKAKCSMNRHMICHQHPSELPLFECSECSFKAKRKSDLSQHRESHKDNPQRVTYKCEYCPFQAVVKSSMRYHMLKHKDCPDVKLLECYTCGYKTQRKQSLINHLNRHRMKDLPAVIYKCDQCPFRTKSKNGLHIHRTMHRRMQTSEPKMFKCEFCGWNARYKSKLEEHQERHRDPLKCSFCTYENRYKRALKRHVRRWHGDKTGGIPKSKGGPLWKQRGVSLKTAPV